MPSDDELQAGRSAALEAILASGARLKLIVAGPGTGKTYTFQSIVNQTEGRCLVITFLQVLVKDLETKFGDSADVCSFHSSRGSCCTKVELRT
jgi:superfamily II DNA or RNA helicase